MRFGELLTEMFLASGGRGMALFTSYEMMNTVYPGVKERLEAENSLLREHNAFLQSMTDRLLPMLPPGPNTTSQASKAPWWALWRRRNRGEGADTR